MKEKIIALLTGIDSDFQAKQDFIFNHDTADVYAFRKGRNFVFPQRDYFFFHNIDERNITPDLAEKLHNSARAFVNSEYKVPKALRLTVPNITSVFYSAKGVEGGMIQLASKWTRSVIGGEIHQIMVIDFASKTFYSQGTHAVRASVEGFAVKIKFSKIDPQNRAHYLIEQLTGSL
jgi:hypothetical protein